MRRYSSRCRLQLQSPRNRPILFVFRFEILLSFLSLSIKKKWNNQLYRIRFVYTYERIDCVYLFFFHYFHYILWMGINKDWNRQLYVTKAIHSLYFIVKRSSVYNRQCIKVYIPYLKNGLDLEVFSYFCNHNRTYVHICWAAVSNVHKT